MATIHPSPSLSLTLNPLSTQMPFTMRVEHLMNSSETINAALDFRDVVNAWQVAALSVQHW